MTKIQKRTEGKIRKSLKALAEPKAEPKALAKVEPQAEPQAEPKAEPQDGYATFRCTDSASGIVFTVHAPIERGYCSAVIADTPLGRRVIRWTKDSKAAMRYARACNALASGQVNKLGTPGCSSAIVVDVDLASGAIDGSVPFTRTRAAAWYAAMEAANN